MPHPHTLNSLVTLGNLYTKSSLVTQIHLVTLDNLVTMHHLVTLGNLCIMVLLWVASWSQQLNLVQHTWCNRWRKLLPMTTRVWHGLPAFVAAGPLVLWQY